MWTTTTSNDNNNIDDNHNSSSSSSSSFFPFSPNSKSLISGGTLCIYARTKNIVTSYCEPPQWGTADAEIETLSVKENTELKGSPLETWSGSVYSHVC